MPVADQGTTRVALAGSPGVLATIVTRHAIGSEAEGRRITRCTGGRTVCSLVDQLTIAVAGRAIAVPPRAVLLLADVDDAGIRRIAANRYELVLTCGDAAPAYRARLFFSRERVLRLDIWSDEAGMIEQRTVFHDVSRAFR